MKLLVIDAGGREHALSWKLAQSRRVTEVLVAPGNAGTATEAKYRDVQLEAIAPFQPLRPITAQESTP